MLPKLRRGMELFCERESAQTTDRKQGLAGWEKAIGLRRKRLVLDEARVKYGSVIGCPYGYFTSLPAGNHRAARGRTARFTDIAKPFDLSLNAITKHLKLLERAGLISREKQGREVLISFRPEPLRLVSGWVHEYEQFWSERLDQFEGFFKEKRKKSHETRDEDD